MRLFSSFTTKRRRRRHWNAPAAKGERRQRLSVISWSSKGTDVTKVHSLSVIWIAFGINLPFIPVCVGMLENSVMCSWFLQRWHGGLDTKPKQKIFGYIAAAFFPLPKVCLFSILSVYRVCVVPRGPFFLCRLWRQWPPTCSTHIYRMGQLFYFFFHGRNNNCSSKKKPPDVGAVRFTRWFLKRGDITQGSYTSHEV